MIDATPATTAQLADPRGLAVDATGTLYIADCDEYWDRVRRVDRRGSSPRWLAPASEAFRAMAADAARRRARPGA